MIAGATQGATLREGEPGDDVRWDGAIPHDAEVLGDDEGAMLIVSVQAAR